MSFDALTIEDVMPYLIDKETKRRFQAIVHVEANLCNALNIDEISLELSDHLVQNLKDNNHRIAMLAISCLRQISSHIFRISKPQLSLMINGLIACLGNSKTEVRDIAQLALIDLLRVLSVDEIFNHLISAAKTSANARIRESVLRFFTLAVDHLSALGVIPFGHFLPVVIELLNDRAAEVREAAVSVLETMYVHVGEPLADELQTRPIRSAQLRPILDRLQTQQCVPVSERVALFRKPGQSNAAALAASAPTTAMSPSNHSVPLSPGSMSGLRRASSVSHLIATTAPNMANLVASSSTSRLMHSPSAHSFNLSLGMSNLSVGMSDDAVLESMMLSSPQLRRASTSLLSTSASRSGLFPARPMSASPSASTLSPARSNSVSRSSSTDRPRSAQEPRRVSRGAGGAHLAAAFDASQSYHAQAVSAGRMTTDELRVAAEDEWRDGVSEAPLAPIEARALSPEARQARRLSSAAERTGNATVQAAATAAAAIEAHSILRAAAEDADCVAFSTEIRPLQVRSPAVGGASQEKELSAEFSRLADILRDDRTANWKDRIAAMHRAAALVAGASPNGSGEPCPEVISPLLLIRDGITTQLQDLRSAVAKEACALICFLARHLRNRIEVLMEESLPVIFRLLIRTHTGVFTDSAHATARCVLKHVRVPKLLHRLLDGASDRSNVLRARCSDYMLLALELFETPALEKYAQALEVQVGTMLRDKSDEVRQNARKTYWALHRHWDLRAERLLRSLETGQQRALMDVRATYVPTRFPLPPVYPLSILLSTQPSAFVPAAPPSVSAVVHDHRRRTSQISSDDVAAAVTKPRKSILKTSHTDSDDVPRGPVLSGPTAAALAAALSASAARFANPVAAPAPVSQPAAPAPVAAPEPPKSTSLSGASSRMAPQRVPISQPNANHPSGPPASLFGSYGLSLNMPSAGMQQSASSASIASTTSLASNSSAVAPVSAWTAADVQLSSSGLSEVAESVPTIVESTKAKNPFGFSGSTVSTAALLDEFDAPVDAAESSAPSKSLQPAQSDLQLRQPRKLTRQSLSSSAIETQQAPESVQTEQAPASNAFVSALEPLASILLPEPNAPPSLDLQALYKDGNSATEWQVRCSAFERFAASLRGLLPTESGQSVMQVQETAIVAAAADKLTNLFEVRLVDPHHRVSESVLFALVELVRVPALPASLAAYLDRLVPRVFVRLTDLRENVRQAANAVLNELCKSYRGDALFPSLLRTLDNQSSKVKMGCLEFMLHLVPDSDAYISIPMYMKAVLNKLSPLIHEAKHMALRKITCSVAKVLYERHEVTFLSQFILLPNQAQHDCARILATFIPDLSRNLLLFQRAGGAKKVAKVAAAAAAAVSQSMPEQSEQPIVDVPAESDFVESQVLPEPYTSPLRASTLSTLVSNSPFVGANQFDFEADAKQPLQSPSPFVNTLPGNGLVQFAQYRAPSIDRLPRDTLSPPSKFAHQQMIQVRQSEPELQAEDVVDIAQRTMAMLMSPKSQPTPAAWQSPLVQHTPARLSTPLSTSALATPQTSTPSNRSLPRTLSPPTPILTQGPIEGSPRPVIEATHVAPAASPAPVAQPRAAASPLVKAPSVTFAADLSSSTINLPSLLMGFTGATLDPNARLQYLRRLLHLTKQPTERGLLRAHMGSVLRSTIQALKDPNVGMRDLASLVLGSLVFQFNNDSEDGDNAQVIASHTADCLSALIDVMKGTSLQPAPREIRDAAQDALLTLLPALHVSLCYDVTLDLIRGGEAFFSNGVAGTVDMTLVALKMLAKLIAQDSPASVSLRAEQLSEALTVTMRSTSADVRKCSVFCLVEMFLHMHDTLTPLLQSRLTQNELRLVTIYVTKSIDARSK